MRGERGLAGGCGRLCALAMAGSVLRLWLLLAMGFVISFVPDFCFYIGFHKCTLHRLCPTGNAGLTITRSSSAGQVFGRCTPSWGGAADGLHVLLLLLTQLLLNCQSRRHIGQRWPLAPCSKTRGKGL